MKTIKSIEIKNSPFFKDKFKIEFSDRLNCIMGGRGTGKSTILHFIKSTLDPESENDNTTYSLLKNNLNQGEIILKIQAEDGNIYNISKHFNDEPHPEVPSTGEIFPIKNILSDISCDIYPAARIEEIGRKPEDRLLLIDKMQPKEIEPLKDEIKTIQITLDKNAQEIKTIKAKYNQKMGKIRDFESVADEIKIHKKSKPKDLDDKIDKEFEKEGKKLKTRRQEKKFIEKLLEFFDETQTAVDELTEDVSDFKKNNDLKDYNFVNKEIMSSAANIYTDTVAKIKSKLKEIKNILTLSENETAVIKENISQLHDKQQGEYNKIKKKIESNRQYYNKLEELSKREDQWKGLKKECSEIEQKKKRIEEERKKLVLKLNKKKQEIYSNRLDIVEKLNNEFNGEIKIILQIGGLLDEYENTLKDSLRGSGIRYNELVPRIVQHFPPDKFAEIIHNKDIEKLKSIFHIDETRAEALITALYETSGIYEIESIYCQDLPNFYLKIEKGSTTTKDNYVKSDELSTGQRCTTVLPIVFAVSNNPLIIDQPEDNLDNKYITQSIYKIINDQKKKRQLIFITHNPNIPVLSNSEFNLFLNFHTHSEILSEGSIDDVKDSILKILEGGEEAFRLRNKIYKIFKEK